ncbi:periplasmic trehalase [Escherichia coli]|uniref:Periplasmic trehalase n=1 Tax=Escherichia coli TaxID=562 RepID=A0A377D112_ECOLX|nr:periplasmic trehalase [Escherichia coli]
MQNAKLFPDQKTFADAVPNSDPLMILADYRMQQNQSGFDLRHFVNVNFTLPKEGEKYVPPEGQSLREHIDGLWAGINAFYRKHRKMGFSVTAAGTLCRAGRTLSRGILLGQLLHHV